MDSMERSSKCGLPLPGAGRAGPSPGLRPAAVDSSWLEDEWRQLLSAQTALPVVEADRPRPPGDGEAAAVPTAVLRVLPAAAASRGQFDTRTTAVQLLCGPEREHGASTVWSRVKEVLLDYTHTAHLHGVVFIGDVTSSVTERVLWAVAALLSGVLLLSMSWMQYQNYVHSPTVTTIEENNLPTHSFPFPAVTLCPSRRLRENVLASALDRYFTNDLSAQNVIKGQNVTASRSEHWTKVIAGMVLTLAHYQYPGYRIMNSGLRLIGSKLIFLDGFVISQVMMQGRMTCSDILAHCYWRGVAFSCCEQFQLQRTEMGYCMSFNSRTSTGPKILCTERNCHHVWSTGPGTGLELVFKRPVNLFSDTLPAIRDHLLKIVDELGRRPEVKPNYRPETISATWESEDLFLLLNAWSHLDTVLVMVHDRETFPDVTAAYPMPTRERVDISMAVAFTGTVAGKELKNLPANKRECLFHGEVNVQIARKYSLSECISECRVLHIAKLCGCVPYFIEAYQGTFYNGFPECRFSQLPCVAGLNLQAINCSHCIPECNFNHYDIRTFPSINVKVKDAYLGSTLEISYDMFRTAVLYRQKFKLSSLDMIVAFGGLASLCLGCSILTGLDILQMVIKVGQAVFGYKFKSIYLSNSERDERHENLRRDVTTPISKIFTYTSK